MKITYLTILILSVTAATTYSAVLPENSPTIIESESTVPVEEDDFVLPEGVTACKQNDPELNQCIKDSVNHQLPLLNKGSKILDIPPLDPLRIPDGRYGYSSGPVGGTLILKGVNVYGVSKSSVKKVNTKVLDDGVVSNILIYFPRVLIEGSYKADVKINELKMRPKGFFNLTISEMTINTKMVGQYTTINGKKHLQLKSFDAEPEIGDLKIFATGLFPDPTLNNIVLDFANQYWPEIVKTVMPQTKSTWEPLVIEAANKFLGAVPFEKLLTKE